MGKVTPAEAEAFSRRWAQANRAEIDELRASSPDLALRQLESLLSAVDIFGWRDELDRESEKVRSRWNRLRAHFHV